MKKIYFIVPYPFDEAPSQRFRFEQYFDVLSKNGFSYQVSPFWSESAWKILYKSGFYHLKFWFLITGFVKRITDLYKVLSYDWVFIHREATPILPPFFEIFIAQILRKKIIYDFDDAIWMNDSNDKNKILNFLKCHWKVKFICKWSYKVSVGNDYLANYVKKYQSNSIINPTTVIPINKRSQNNSHLVTIGWTGTHSTLKYLEIVFPVLVKLSLKYDFQFIIISNDTKRYDNLPFVKNILWQKHTEINDLQTIDIGIMPLFDEEWVNGKCGFKILQFFALGIPVLASPFGVNFTIIENKKSGYLAYNEQDWYTYLELLLTNSNLRKELGKNGFERVSLQYSKASNSQNFLQLFT